MHDLFDLVLDLVGQLVAVAAEKLDAVVAEGIMRSGDDDARRHLMLFRKIRNGRRRYHARDDRMAARRADARRQRRNEHRPGNPRVASDQDLRLLRAPLAEIKRSRTSQIIRKLRRQLQIRLAAHTVRPKHSRHD